MNGINEGKIESMRKIHARLARLEDEQEELRISGNDPQRLDMVHEEMKSLREKASIILNSPCPVVK